MDSHGGESGYRGRRHERLKEVKREVSSDREKASSSRKRHHEEYPSRRERSKSPNRERREWRRRGRSPIRWERSPRDSEKWGKRPSPPSRSEVKKGKSPKREAPCYEPSGALKADEKLIKWEAPSFDSGEKTTEKKPAEMEKPSFEPSGKLTEDTNTFKGVVIKYNEPPEAQVPRVKWRLYPFKGEQHLPEIFVHRQSAYLIGRERKIADLPIDHPSCSKQHAVLQYRSIPYERQDGSRGRKVKPYIIDLGSANGTYLNGDRIDSQRYVELRERDILKFGFSTREYVVLSEKSAEGGSEDSDRSEGEPDIDITGAEERRIKDEDNMF